jgi:predicted ABC-type ATPase
MTMGGPGSGKSAAMRDIDKSSFVQVNPDDIRVELPEWAAAVDPKATYKDAAAKTHEESSFLAKRVLKEAVEQGKNVLVDGTGGHLEGFLNKMQMLKDHGYKVHVVVAHTDEQTGRGRIAERAEKEGRDVPERMIATTYAAMPKNIGHVMKLADHIKIFDTTSRPAKPVYEKSNGKEVRYDEGTIAKFR